MLLKSFVLIDLKTDKLSHADIGQIDMYVRMYDDLKKSEDDNPTIGIVLCTEKDETVVKYSVLAENENLFASKYITAILMATPFSTWFSIIDCFESATSLVSSTPRFIGPGCMITISLDKESSIFLFIP